jgi:hypothetical protein
MEEHVHILSGGKTGGESVHVSPRCQVQISTEALGILTQIFSGFSPSFGELWVNSS